MSQFHHDSTLERTFKALKKDLLREGGAQISTTRNYNFAIVPYDPNDEFTLRSHVSRLSAELRDAGWSTATIALNTLLLERLRGLGDDYLGSLIAREKRLAKKSPERAMNHLRERIVQEIEGPEGLAADVVREIKKLLDENPDNRERTVVFIARAGALYPFFRTSALLKHVADHTQNIPVILLYPGQVIGEAGRGDAGLSFMGKLPADRDYRPRIYRPA
jgi:hypothetical protein